MNDLHGPASDDPREGRSVGPRPPVNTARAVAAATAVAERIRTESAVPSPASRADGRGTLWVDVASSYALTAARIGAWAGVSALVYRGPRPADFGLLVLLRGTIALVGYTSLGLGPAMVRMLSGPPAAGADGRLPARAAGASRPSTTPAAAGDGQPFPAAIPVTAVVPVLVYAGTGERTRTPPGPPTTFQAVYSTGASLAWVLAVLAVAATFAYASCVDRVHVTQGWDDDDARSVVLWFGIGTALRVLGEPLSAALQARGRLAIDNVLLASAEVGWLVLAAAAAMTAGGIGAAAAAGLWLLANLALFVGRAVAVAQAVPDAAAVPAPFRGPVARRLLAFGSGVLAAQLADFLFAPMAYVVINRLLPPADLLAYAPAVQVDGALLLLVGGLAAALFPRVAAAHAAGDVAAVRRYYRAGTLAGGAALAAAAVLTLLLARPLLTAWLGRPLPATVAILPLVLVHTVVGGSAAVGRAVLLGVGRVWALTVSALIAGAANVGLAVLFVAGFGWGLRGVVLATVVVVVARAGVWMPWYVHRVLRGELRAARERDAAGERP